MSQRDARKATIGRREALALARAADEVYAVKGRRVAHRDLRRERPDEATLADLVLGPTGNLRAPALRLGRTLIVGFDEATYRRVVLGRAPADGGPGPSGRSPAGPGPGAAPPGGA